MGDSAKIEELFHYFNIQDGIDTVFGNWAVSTSGDIVNFVYPFVIPSIHLNDEDWLTLLKSKVWFKDICINSFLMALERAKSIHGQL